ncbi:MAG TPA: hypothetical protein PKE29_02430, partial [Phycisphaerales bacterium]|nr:hypothetical protein [Phycisphaerales bacterium]
DGHGNFARIGFPLVPTPPKLVPLDACAVVDPLAMPTWFPPKTLMAPMKMPVPRISNANGRAELLVVAKEIVAGRKPWPAGSKRTEKMAVCPAAIVWAGCRTTVNSPAFAPEMVMKPCEPGARVIDSPDVFLILKRRAHLYLATITVLNRYLSMHSA